MKQSRHLGRTWREAPKEAQTQAHSLMLMGGYIKQLSAGVYSYLPLAWQVLKKISQIVREEMEKAGAEELLMPALQPKELWEESTRWERYTAVDGIMFAFDDRRKSTCCLGPTHEEVVTDIVRREIESYRDLPKCVFQIQTKFRDEIRPRFGLMRAREFIMKDAYSFDFDEQGLDISYEAMRKAYHAICKRIGFRYREVEADTGAIGGESSHEFMVLADTGEDTIVFCDQCSYAANQERAESLIEEYKQEKEEKPMEAVFGEGLIGVEPLSAFLKIPIWKTTKTLLYQADEDIVAVMIRGDCDVNEVKVANYLGCKKLRLLEAELIKEITGAEVGYAGPIGLPSKVKIIADYFVDKRVNFECGANQTNYHNINVNFGRDLEAPFFGDFKLAKKGDFCPRCKKGRLQEARGIEVGHIFKLGTKYSEKMKCMYADINSQMRPAVMGCYGIGVSRIAAAFIEQNHDQKGIIWSANIAPYQVHLIGLNLEDAELNKKTEAIYEKLLQEGLEVLYDDRLLRAGEKFNDADLIGIPVRITVSKRSLSQNGVEFKLRKSAEAKTLSLEEAIEEIRAALVA